MTKAKSKGSSTTKGASSSSKNKGFSLPWKRSWLSFAAAALGTFQIASCTLNPNWSPPQVIDSIASKLNISQQLKELRDLGQKLPIDIAQAKPNLPSVGGKVESGSNSNATGFANCRQFFPNNALPSLKIQSNQRELCFSGFAVLHDGDSKTPVFVAQRLNRQVLTQGKGLQRTDKFYADARLPRAERAELGDYKGSGYARGHMAPAGDMFNEDSMAQSFSLANMVPQNQKQNSGAWSQVEQATRKYVLRAQGDVYVFTGPVFESPVQTIGPNKVHVPSHIFKLVYDPGTGRSWVYWLPNSADARMSAPISYDEFKRRTGLPLLSKVMTATGGANSAFQ